MNLKNEGYARRKKYLCKETLMELVKKDPGISGVFTFPEIKRIRTPEISTKHAIVITIPAGKYTDVLSPYTTRVDQK